MLVLHLDVVQASGGSFLPYEKTENIRCFSPLKLIFPAAVSVIVKMKIAVRRELKKVVPAYSVREL